MARKKKDVAKSLIKATSLPEGIEKFGKDPSFNNLEAILPGERFTDLRTRLREQGIAEYQDAKIAADFDQDGRSYGHCRCRI